MAKKTTKKPKMTMKSFEGTKADIAVDKKAIAAINKKRKK